MYNDSLDRYIIGSKISDSYINAPFMMTQDEYRKWSERRMMNQFFRKKNDEIYQAKGKEKFDFTDMHFDLGPAEKIFGPGGVRIKTQGTAELKFGATMKSIDNPSLPVRNRKTTTMDFDEKINVSLNGRVGDKVNMNLNYNTDATFDFDAQSLKLKYDGKEDEIVKLIEAGNVSFPSNSSLVRGASSLFGLRTDQLVASQKKSSSKSVSSKGGKQFTPFEIDASNYEENRHFFLAQYFHDRYDESMRSLPNLTSGVTINRVEVWVTNKSGNTSNTRNIIALTDLGENNRVSNSLWSVTGQPVPDIAVCCRTRHRPDLDRARRNIRLRGRSRLREAGACASAQLVGVHREQGAGLRLAEDIAADRPGARRGLRVHIRRCDVSGGRVRIGHHRL